MAVVANLESLGMAVAGAKGAGNMHAWLDSRDGLVFGTFPIVTSRFDFATEKRLAKAEASGGAKRTISHLGSAKRVVRDRRRFYQCRGPQAWDHSQVRPDKNR